MIIGWSKDKLVEKKVKKRLRRKRKSSAAVSSCQLSTVHLVCHDCHKKVRENSDDDSSKINIPFSHLRK